jgi:hypothetical protein
MPDLSPTLLGVAASLALFAIPSPTHADRLADPRGGPSPAEIAELRARGPAALEALLATYDHAAPAEREALAAEIDAVAGQRYATASRLYWYTDLDRAEQAAHQLHRPILALRMLGDLRDDLSCANSRLFRATLYANTAVSAFLRSHFVLYWSSERTVPTITIDFGDGRKIVRTTTGNSAHYVLDEDGHVLDVLPGLYAPAVFQRELTASLALADQIRGMTTAQRIRATVAYHAAALAATDRAWQAARSAQYVHGKQFLLGAGELASAIARAQRATVSKMRIEVPDLRAIGLMRPGDVPDDAAAWSAIGQAAWNISAPPPGPETGPEPVQAVEVARRAARAVEPVPPPMVLDAASRALVAQLHNAGPADQRATPAELAAVIARLEQHIVADTALDQFTLRQQIHRRIVDRGETELAPLNAWIYDAVFATPASDRWLGLRARTDFTGLPGDGVVMR